MAEEADWNALQRDLWRVVLTTEHRLGESAADHLGRILAALRANGYQLDAASTAQIEAYLNSVSGMVKTALDQVLTPLASATLAPAMRSEFIANATRETFTRRWPDGLTLSNRIWDWQQETRAGITKTLNQAIHAGEAVNRIVYDLQYAAEAITSERFAIIGKQQEDWASQLADTGRALIRNQTTREAWAENVRAVQQHIKTLQVTGTRTAANHTLNKIVEAVQQGRTELIDNAMKWWIYDRQLYQLKRIARTELANAHHRGIIEASKDNDFIIGYHWRLSPSHSQPDICDYYADIELGLGAGVWPKDKVPEKKAHPHCMCALIPRTRKIARQGAKSYADFLEALPAGQRNKILPQWAQGLHRLGMPLTDLSHPDGTLVTREELAGKIGKERLDAAISLGKAVEQRDWGTVKIRAGRADVEEMRRIVREHPEDPDLMALSLPLETIPEGGRGLVSVDSGAWHYARRRYIDGETGLTRQRDLDLKYESILGDRSATVYVQRSGQAVRYCVHSGDNVAFLESNGRRVSSFQLHPGSDPAEIGEKLCKISDLLG
ncbi:conserved hypothetical protein [Gammaproteobacteria bacterium]